MKIICTNRQARVAGAQLLTNGSAGLNIDFEFSPAWDGLNKIVCFKGSGTAIDVLLAGNSCVVPSECLTEYGSYLEIGVYGYEIVGEETKVIIPTVWANAGEIREGVKPSETEPSPITPSIADQVIQIAESVRRDADSGKFDGKDGYTPIKGVDYFDGKDGKDGKDGDGKTPIKGVDYFDGKDGYTPIKGVDYFDGRDGRDGVDGRDGYTPQKGIDYFDGQNGRDGIDGRDGYTPIKGVDYFDGKDGEDGKDYTITSADYAAIADMAAERVPQYDDSELRTAVEVHSAELENQASNIENLETEVNNRVADVTINGASIVDGGVAAVPIATNSSVGAVRGASANGTFVESNGIMRVFPAAEANIFDRSTMQRPIVPANLDYAVKSAMSDGKGAAWTDAEQAAARARMGCHGRYEFFQSLTISEDVKSVSVDVGFEVDGIALVCNIKAAAAAGSGYLYLLQSGENQTNVTFSSAINTSDRYEYLIAEKDGFWRSIYINSAGENWQGNYYGTTKTQVSDASADSFVFAAQSNTVIKAGSKIDVYVRRA